MAFPTARSVFRTSRNYSQSIAPFSVGRPSLEAFRARTWTARSVILISQSSAASCSRRQVLIELTGDIEGLGMENDRILVNPGRARNQLIPTGQARFVPWKRPADREPRKQERPASLAASSASQSPTAAVITPTPPEVLAALKALPSSLIFPHRTVSPTADGIHGSVTLADVSRKLEEEYGVPSSAVDLMWTREDAEARMKELGVWEAQILPSGGEDAIILNIEVMRIE